LNIPKHDVNIPLPFGEHSAMKKKKMTQGWVVNGESPR
jgi:hypothetical protein